MAVYSIIERRWLDTAGL